MRLLHIILSLDIGGAQRLLSDLLPLQKQNNDVKLLVLKGVDTVFKELLRPVVLKLLICIVEVSIIL